MSWSTVVVLAAGAYAFKLFGLLALSRVKLTGPLANVVGLLPAAIFAGLVIQQTLTGGGGDIVATRVLGVAAGVVAVWAKAPLLVVILVSAGTAALARLLI
ncbi:MAG TPA: AzlD domain-containing protein [Microthrixaceae bacterium]|nr:AzlD domain-containing protein [Microthrixaceae bacterium]HNI36020.1 AzlD domain-containing protein [Microthrixaceae bacterium]